MGSRHVRDAIADLAPVPVLTIPSRFPCPAAFADATPPDGLPDGFPLPVRLRLPQCVRAQEPAGRGRGVHAAFAPGSGASLVIKALNAEHDPASHQRLARRGREHPDIHLIERRLSASERDGLTDAADCYVSLHRAEGFGYTMAESMWAGKPVIATGYSGNLDFMSDDNSYLVDYRLVQIGPGNDPYPADGSWAEPDVRRTPRGSCARSSSTRRRRAGAVSGPPPTSAPATGRRRPARFIVDRLRRILASPQWRQRSARPARSTPAGWTISSAPGRFRRRRARGSAPRQRVPARACCGCSSRSPSMSA